MKEIISKAMSSGMDFTRGSTIKSFLNRMDIDQDVYDRAYIVLKNSAFKKSFSSTPYNHRVVLLPHCLRNVNKCKAEFTDHGYICAGCGACDIKEIKEFAEDLGYKGVFIIPGGSMVRMIMKKMKPAAVVGVACFLELAESMEQVIINNIIPQGVPLLKDGCKDTVVDKEELKRILKQ
ncbi:MAG: DUF116 domain-containing protein [Thermoplasmata archaeon]